MANYYPEDPAAPAFFTVTVTFKMTAEQRAAYAREYSLSTPGGQPDPDQAVADITEHAAGKVSAAISTSYDLREFTTHSTATTV
jgi:hypothetical protein